MRSLEQWLSYQAQAHPQSIDLGLERLQCVLERLHWRQPTVPVITVAGTNGKGSVSAYCTSILTAAGYRVGTFTSPHLRDYRERIRIDAAYASSDALRRAFEKIETACIGAAGECAAREGARPRDLSLTFFEYNALAAILIFESARLDAWVLEVGMGGRLDAVNVVDPSVAVVVSIGLDHQEFLGSTLEAIAREKAGIFRPGVAAVLASRAMPAVLESIAQAIGAPLKRLGLEYRYTRHASRWHYRGTRWDLPHLPTPALLGDAQYRNAAAAIAALEELDARLRVPAEAIARGLRNTRLVGRFQVIKPAATPNGDAPRVAAQPTWILDVAHNPDAARVLAQNLRELSSVGRTLAVCGILADKDAPGVVAQLRDCIDAWWFASTEGARGTSGAALAAQLAPILGVPTAASASVGAACAEALQAAGPLDRIVVFGSFHTVGPALDWLEGHGLLPSERLPEYTAPPDGSEKSGI
jgi:dihydrofolate synthase/folylpolyglutamate synthase